jgi:hypothetical protein
MSSAGFDAKRADPRRLRGNVRKKLAPLGAGQVLSVLPDMAVHPEPYIPFGRCSLLERWPRWGAAAIYSRPRSSAMTHNEKRAIRRPCPFLADPWRCQPTAGRVRHLRGSVDARGPHDRCGSAPGSRYAVRPRSPTQRQNDDVLTADADRQDDVRCGSGGTDPSVRRGPQKAEEMSTGAFPRPGRRQAETARGRGPADGGELRTAAGTAWRARSAVMATATSGWGFVRRRADVLRSFSPARRARRPDPGAIHAQKMSIIRAKI